MTTKTITLETSDMESEWRAFQAVKGKAVLPVGEIGKRICESLGLERCVWFKIEGGIDRILTVTAECHVDAETTETFVRTLESLKKQSHEVA